MQRLLGVVGNIASGKSTLVGSLSRALQTTVEAERWFENPFLEAAQRDPRYAFPTESWFLTASASAHARLEAVAGGILERPVAEHLEVFVMARAAAGELTSADVSALRHLASGFTRVQRPLDLVVFLDAPPDELRRRIVARDRRIERSLYESDLAALAQRYTSFVARLDVPVIKIDTSSLDVRTDEGVEEVVRRVRQHLA